MKCKLSHVFLLCCTMLNHAQEKPGNSASQSTYRVIISSDFPPLDVIPGGAVYGPAEKHSDPDDLQSMVRFLLYSKMP